MKLTDLLDQIDRLEGHITPGPWEAVGRPYNACVSPAGQIRNLARLGDPLDPEAWSNAEFIALARTALPKLAEAVYQVLSLLDAEEKRTKYQQVMFDGTPFPPAVSTNEVRQAITDAMEGQ